MKVKNDLLNWKMVDLILVFVVVSNLVQLVYIKAYEVYF